MTTQEETKNNSPISNGNLDKCTTIVNECKSSTESPDDKAISCQATVDDISSSDINRLLIDSEQQQQHGSADNFHDKYKTKSIIFKNQSCIVFLGETKKSSLNVSIKRPQCNDTYELREYRTEDGTLRKCYVQNMAQIFNVENGKGSVLKALDWYVYDNYFVLVTEYDEVFECVYRLLFAFISF